MVCGSGYSCRVHSRSAKLDSSGSLNSRSGVLLNRPSGGASYRCSSSTRWSELARGVKCRCRNSLAVGQRDRPRLHKGISRSISQDRANRHPIAQRAFRQARTRANKGPLSCGPKSSVRHSMLTPIDIDRCGRLIPDRLRVSCGRIPEQDRPNGLRSPLRQASDSRRIRR